MELEEFIKETIVQITNGVKEAQEELKDTGCVINPEGFVTESQRYQSGPDKKFRSVQKLKINAVLTVNEKEGSKSGIGIAKIVRAGIDAEQSSSNQQMNSIEFEIPIALPVMEKES